MEEVVSSYVPMGTTLLESDYKKAAREWLASLPRYPRPDAEILNGRREARQHRREGLRDHCRRERWRQNGYGQPYARSGTA